MNKVTSSARICDINNLSETVLELQPGDRIDAMSDGVYDNYFPVTVNGITIRSYEKAVEIVQQGKLTSDQIHEEIAHKIANTKLGEIMSVVGKQNPPKPDAVTLHSAEIPDTKDWKKRGWNEAQGGWLYKNVQVFVGLANGGNKQVAAQIFYNPQTGEVRAQRQSSGGELKPIRILPSEDRKQLRLEDPQSRVGSEFADFWP